MLRKPPTSEFIRYLISTHNTPGDSDRLPSLNEISQELGVSVAQLREQLEVARALGLVEVRPHKGMRYLPYNFLPAIWMSISYALAIDSNYFEALSDLRNHIETTYWHQAVRKLTPEDQDDLRALISRAWEKLRGTPIQIPHVEHRQLHLCIYRKLENPFVLGILEAYWEAYEDIGLNRYADYEYLSQVWVYHQKMVDSICSGDYETGYKALIEHTELIHYRPISPQAGEDGHV